MNETLKGKEDLAVNYGMAQKVYLVKDVDKAVEWLKQEIKTKFDWANCKIDTSTPEDILDDLKEDIDSKIDEVF